MKVFVYGTLKEGGRFGKRFDNYRLSSEKAKLVGFDLYNISGYFPGIAKGEGTVFGELHEFEKMDAVMGEMDIIEGFEEENPSESLFVRKVAKVETQNGEEEAYIYVFNKPLKDYKKIEKGVWEL